ncbi:spore cortex-lytic enzyme [Brevibacillus dissolubilis]|uniref:spore cortex-lytic enzyme n=1 Tax=Brevibacillus dissolubilis TaxID=1844116 RepID=UPI001117664D|nr:spore cortex-lytic enzyme [Brevibacillus dissolubilis]
MQRFAKLFWLLAATVITFAAISGSMPQTSEAFSKRIVKVGAAGSDVKEMQGRLKYLGYYTGTIDGDFGWRSYWALRRFQYEFGLPVDGVLGAKTKVKLYNATKKWRPTYVNPARSKKKSTSHVASHSSNDINLMANAVYGESRGEPYIGQVAVAAVILNRTRHSGFPDSPASVIFEPGAFTAVADGQIYLTPNERAKKAVRDALKGWDPTGGCIYYFNPHTATSKWIWGRPQVKRIGKHIFCR